MHHDHPNHPTVPAFRARVGLSPQEHVQWAAWNLDRYREHMHLWELSLQHGRCNFMALVHADRMLYGALINFKDAGMDAEATRMEVALDHMDHFIADLMHRPLTPDACALKYQSILQYIEV